MTTPSVSPPPESRCIPVLWDSAAMSVPLPKTPSRSGWVLPEHGKTYLAVAMAVSAFRRHEINRIILTRPAVEAGEKLGFLPGDLQNKVDPYLRPLYDALFDMLGAETFQKYHGDGATSKWRRWPICADAPWTIPLSFWMRRRTPRRSR